MKMSSPEVAKKRTESWKAWVRAEGRDPDKLSTFEKIDSQRLYMTSRGKKTLHNSDVSKANKNVKDIAVFGVGDIFKLLSKASSEKEGWMKSTKAMETPVGCVIQVTTQQRNPDGSYAVAEALTFVPGVRIQSNAVGKKLVLI
jgi:hypothetical protein